VDECNRRNLEVHRADAHSRGPKQVKLIGSSFVEGQNRPTAVKLIKLKEFPISLDVAANFSVPRDDSEPAAPLLFNADNRRSDLPVG